jgi:hypothetical protein
MIEIERKECEKGGVGSGGVFDVADEGAEEGGGGALRLHSEAGGSAFAG